MTDTKYVHIDWKDMYKDELAQELATEREKVLSEVEKLQLCHTCGCDKLLKAKLNQLKEGK